MKDTSFAPLKGKRRQLDVPSQLLAIPVGFLCVLALTGAISLPSYFQSALCPPSSFKHWRLVPGSESLIFGILIGPLSLVTLFACILARCRLLSFSGDIQPAPPGKYNMALILMSVCGVFIGGALFVNNADFYYCLTPTDIVIRAGYFDTPKELTWSDVNTVWAWCSTERPPKGAPYKGATLKLSFTDGENLLIGLVSGAQVLMQDDENIKNALKNKNYQYYVNSTVNPETCPSGLYPLLWNWRSG